MKIRNLRYAVTAAECGSLNKASELLFLSQPNLSFAIHSLEEELGYDIFYRTNRGIHLTERGAEFIILARNILDNYKKMKKLDHTFDTVHYHIASTSASILMEPFYKLCLEYQSYPGFQFRLSNRQTSLLLDMVYQGNCDFGIFAYSSGQSSEIRDTINKYHLTMKHLKTFACNVNFRQGHPALDGEFHIEKLWNYPFVDYSGKGFFSYHELASANIINPSRMILVDERELRCRLVSETDAFSIGIPLSNKERTRFDWVSIPYPDLMLNLAYVYKGTQPLDAMSLHYLELLNQELIQL